MRRLIDPIEAASAVSIQAESQTRIEIRVPGVPDGRGVAEDPRESQRISGEQQRPLSRVTTPRQRRGRDHMPAVTRADHPGSATRRVHGGVTGGVRHEMSPSENQS